MRFIKKTLLTNVQIALATALFFTPSQADDDKWIAHKKSDLIYEVMLPENNQIHTSTLNMGNGRMAFGEFVKGITKDNSEDANERTYTLQVMQTLGHPLDTSYLQSELEKRIKSYLDTFIPYNGKLLNRDKYYGHSTMYASDIYLTYDDPKQGPTYLRTKIYLTGSTLALQTVSGSEASIYAYKSKSYFDSMTLYDGTILTNASMKDEWKPYLSPLHIFTAHFPEQDQIYIHADPEIHNSDKSEVMLFKFNDPYLEKTMHFNVYGYRFNANLDQAAAISVAIKRHLQKQNISLNERTFSVPDTNAIQTFFSMRPTANNKYSERGRLYAKYQDNYMLLYEMWGPLALIDSTFADNLIDTVDFHPEKAAALLQEQKNMPPTQNSTTE